MTELQWNAFEKFRNEFKAECKKLALISNELSSLQKDSSLKDTPPYPLENSIVYNKALDEITAEDEIHLIVIGDNPGKEEQLTKNQKYLVGQSGRIAEGFFRRNSELCTDFRKNVIILNKTSVHTAKTSHLKYLIKNGTDNVRNLILESQTWMAEKTAELHKSLVENTAEGDFVPELWLVGYAELKGKGLFLPYRDNLKKAYIYSAKCQNMGTDLADSFDKAWSKVYVYQHFSMNRFLIDLKSYQKENPNDSLKISLEKLGCRHKDEIFNY